MAVHVGEITIPANSAVGVFSATGVTPAVYTLTIPGSFFNSGNTISLVSSAEASSSGFDPGFPFVLITDESEVYLYNPSDSSFTGYVLFTPIIEATGPTSSSTTYTY